ncbi:MAG: hypothetical protein AAF639_24390 [Chloroflexota bacterium]
MSMKYHRWILLLLVLIAYAWRIQNLGEQSLWRDEVDAVYFAVRDLPDTVAMFVQAAQNGALYFLSLRPWFRLVGTSEFALRYPSLLFSVLSIPLLWKVTSLLVDNHTSSKQTGTRQILPYTPFIATLFLLTNPYQVWYSQEGKMYSLITFLALLAHWCWLRGIGLHKGYISIRNQGQPLAFQGFTAWIGYLCTVSIAIYSHLLMILLIPFHFCWFLIAWPRSKFHWRGYGFALAGLTLPYLPMLWWQWEMLTTSERRTGFGFTPLPEVLESLLLHHARGFLADYDLMWMSPIFFLGLAGLGLGYLEISSEPQGNLPDNRLADWRRFLLIVSWLLLPIAFIHGLSLRQPIFTERYIIWIGPAALILMAFGIQLVWRNTGFLAKPLTIGLLIYVLSFWTYASWQQKTLPMKYDLRSAVTYIHEQREMSPSSLLILQIPHMEFAYRYYSSDLGSYPLDGSDERLGHWRQGLWTNNSLDDERAKIQVNQEMLALTHEADEIWVMRSEVEMWDSRHLMDAWLDEHWQLVEKIGFHGAEVRHYVAKP